jgi:pimeloyl-ACP methyl ester carboxylesterase
MRTLSRLLKALFLIILLLIILVAGFYGYQDIPVEDLKEQYATPPSAFISIDNMAVHYRDEGNPADSLPIVLIHGTGASLHTFDDWTAVLKKERRVVRLDIPGFGLTGPFHDRNYSMDHYVNFLKNFLESLGIQQCILGGNSLGGEIAWRFTIEHPTLVDKLILIDAAGYPSSSKSEPIAFTVARMPVLNKILTFITPRSMAKASVENVYHDKSKVTESLVDRYFKLTLREGNRQALVDRMKLKKDTSKIDLIQTIQQPTLVLWGESDLLITTKNARRFHEDLPNDTLVILENVGHVPMEESPKESLAIVLAFL